MLSMAALRNYYANLITGKVGVRDARIIAAFEAVPREQYVGPGPWKVFAFAAGYIETPSSDPAFLYQDVLVGLSTDQGLNNGEPSLHARCLAALQPRSGEAVLHIGAGTGYYTAVLAALVGAEGSVSAYEIEPALARTASANLDDLPSVTVRNLSGSEASLPGSDIIYVNAGATHPLDAWLDALRPNGRLLFPLTPDQGLGGMLLVTREERTRFSARFVCPAMFFPCQGARDSTMSERLAKAFSQGNTAGVRALHRGQAPDKSCWCAGTNWWLSTD
jgi:protein-L-isoaspartate(D-aspartate) O-methyltransferase